MESDVGRAFRLISDAALGRVSLTETVEAVARAVNCRTGQLIGISDRSGLQFNIMTELAPDALDEFVAVGGDDPFVNSRIRVGLHNREMSWFGDADLTAEQDAARSPAFADWIERNRLGQCRLINLVKRDATLIGFGVVQDSAQHGFTAEDERTLALLAPALRDAVLIRQSIEEDQARIVAGSFDQVARAVFICAADGRIIASSRRAEAMLGEQRWLTAQGNRLTAVGRDEAAPFGAMIARACVGDAAPGGAMQDSAMMLRDRDGAAIMVRVHAFGEADPFRLTRAVMVLPSVPADRERELAWLGMQLFGLTASEAEVMVHLTHGRNPSKIAELLGIQRSTVRSHLKRVFAKSGARSQLEVSAMVRDL